MTREKIHQLLIDWQDRVQEMQRQMDALENVMGFDASALFPAAVYHLGDLATALTAELLEWDCQSLIAWWLDHNFGEQPMKAGLKDEPLRTISTIAELADFVADDLGV